MFAKKLMMMFISSSITLASVPSALGDDTPATTAPPTGVTVLTGATLDLGLLKMDDLSALTRTFTLKRTAQTAKKVAVKFKLAQVQKSCIDYDVEVTDVPEIKQTVCESNLNGGHTCEEVVHEAYQTAKRVCKKEGLILIETAQALELNFKKAVVLTPNADEVFELNITQTLMNKSDYKLKARATETDSVYEIKVRSEKVIFKAK